MSLLESLSTTRRSPLRPNPILEAAASQSLQKPANVAGYQSQPKRSLIRINPKKFPNDFFDIRQTIAGKKRSRFLSELGSLPKVDRLSNRNLEEPKRPEPLRNEEIFKKTSFFKYSEELSETARGSQNRGILSRSETKKSTDRRWKRTADPARSREPSVLCVKEKEDLCENGIFNGTFSKNFFSKELSTDADSPTCDDITNVFSTNNKRYERGYFHLGNLEGVEIRPLEISKTERTDNQVRIRRRVNVSHPMEFLPPISFR